MWHEWGMEINPNLMFPRIPGLTPKANHVPNGESARTYKVSPRMQVSTDGVRLELDILMSAGDRTTKTSNGVWKNPKDSPQILPNLF